MPSRNDIYNKDTERLPTRRRRRSGRRDDQSNDQPPLRRAGPDLYGNRERNKSLADDLGLTRQNEQRMRNMSSRRRRQNKRMSTPNKMLLLLLTVILLVYLVVLGVTLYRGHSGRQAPIAAEPAAPASTGAGGEAAADRSPEEISLLDDAGDLGEPEVFSTVEDIKGNIDRWRSAAESLREVRPMLERGNIDRAIEALERTLDRSPNLISAKMTLADLYTQRERHDEARKLYIKVLDANPQTEGARLKLARSLQTLRDYEAALAMALWLLEEDPLREEPNHIAAMAYMAMNEVADAVPHFRRQLSINRENVRAQHNLGVAYSRLGDHRRAANLFQDVLASDPGNAIAYYNLAVSFVKQDQADDAVEVLTDAAERFGLRFVSAWLRSRDFDPIRDLSAFERLQAAVDADDDDLI